MPAEGSAARVTMVLHKFSRGGSDRVAAYLARGFVNAGMTVDLAVFNPLGEVAGVLSPVLGEGIPVEDFGVTTPYRWLDLLVGLPRLVRHLRANAPDLVISTANNTALITTLAVRLAGLRGCKLALKTTNPIASSRHTGLARALRLWSYRVIFRWTDAVWTLTADESAEMRAEFPHFARLFREVANPYVTSAMLADGDGDRTDRSGKTIVSVARLTAQKRLDLLIRAFARLRTPDARLVILGEGEQRSELEALIAAEGVEDRVAIPGYVDDVSAQLRAADLFVLTSDYEGLPAALLEAMATNCRVLTTDSFPAARSLLAGAIGGELIERREPAALAAQIDRLLSATKAPELRGIAERYTIERGIDSHVRAARALLPHPLTATRVA